MTSAVTPESQSGSQPGGILFKLPKELRLEIYNIMLPPGKINLCSVRDHLKLARGLSNPSEDDWSQDSFADDDSPPPSADDHNPRLVARDYIAMLATCRAVHDEAKPILYENTLFEIQCSGDVRTRCGTLHIMGALGYDQLMSWRHRSPEVDVFHHLRHARSISLNVELDWNNMHGDPWMQEMPIEISGALNLRQLDISFWCMGNAVDSEQFQGQVDGTMSLLGKIKCKCPVTARLETSVGRTGYKSASYYAMIDALKGTDKTPERYAKILADYCYRYYDQYQPDLAKKSSQLTAKSSELEDIQKDLSWADDPTLKARAETLTNKTQKLSSFIASMQRSMEQLWLRIRTRERQRDVLLGGRDTPF